MQRPARRPPGNHLEDRRETKLPEVVLGRCQDCTSDTVTNCLLHSKEKERQDGASCLNLLGLRGAQILQKPESTGSQGQRVDLMGKWGAHSRCSRKHHSRTQPLGTYQLQPSHWTGPPAMK